MVSVKLLVTVKLTQALRGQVPRAVKPIYSYVNSLCPQMNSSACSTIGYLHATCAKRGPTKAFSCSSGNQAFTRSLSLRTLL